MSGTVPLSFGGKLSFLILPCHNCPLHPFLTLTIAYCSAGRPWPHLPYCSCTLSLYPRPCVPTSVTPNVPADTGNQTHCLMLPCLELCRRERWPVIPVRLPYLYFLFFLCDHDLIP